MSFSTIILFCSITLTHTEEGCGKSASCQYNAQCLSRQDGSFKCVCPLCTSIYQPVCGDDGTSYASECELKREACKQKKELRIVERKPCGECSSPYSNFDLVFFISGFMNFKNKASKMKLM